MLSLTFRTRFSMLPLPHSEPLIEQRCTGSSDSLMLSAWAAQGQQTIPMSGPRFLRHPFHARAYSLRVSIVEPNSDTLIS